MVIDRVKHDRDKAKDQPNPNAERFAQIEQAAVECVRSGNRPGERLALMTVALAAADGNAERANKILRDRYGRPDMVPEIERAMSQQNPTEGGYLVPEKWTDEVIPAIKDQALLVNLGVRVLENPTGDLSMARVSASAAAYWKAPEGSKIKATKAKFGRLRLRDKSFAAIVPVSNKLMANAGVSFANFLEGDLLSSVAVLVDKGGWFGKGGEDEPLGLFDPKLCNGTSGVNKVSLSTFDEDALVDLMLAHMEANGTMVNLQWAFGPAVWAKLMKMKYGTSGEGGHIFREEMTKGTLMGVPFKYSNIIKRKDPSTGYLALADWNEFIFAPSRPIQLAKTTEGGYYDDEGNPVLVFGTDETAIRITGGADMGPRQMHSFTLADDVDLT
jgi:HK97 family phage major capsid protein